MKRFERIFWFIVVLGLVVSPVRADPVDVGLILYALDKEDAYLLLAKSRDAENAWTGFYGNGKPGNAERSLTGAIQEAVAATHCHFDFSDLHHKIEHTHFQQPWEDPRYVIYFARILRIELAVLQRGGRFCQQKESLGNIRSPLRWVPWSTLRADFELASTKPGVGQVLLVSSAQHMSEFDNGQFLLPKFAEAIRQMIEISERKDSTIEFTLPW